MSPTKAACGTGFLHLYSFELIIHSMSEPFYSLEKLYQDKMPVTRSQGQSSQMRRGFRGRNQGRLDPLSRPSTPASQAGPSRHPASALHQAADAPAYPAESLDPHISVERLHIVPLENDAYWAIQLNPVSVRIYSPSGGTGRVICSCVEFQKTQTVCAHINVRLLGAFQPVWGLTFF